VFGLTLRDRHEPNEQTAWKEHDCMVVESEWISKCHLGKLAASEQ